MKKSSLSRFLARFSHFKGLIFIFLGLILLSVVGYFVWQRVFYREELASLLPAEQTLAYAELNLDSASPQIQQFQTIFSSHPFLSSAGILQSVNNFVPDYNQIKPWFGGKFGAALITTADHQNPVLVFLIKFSDRNLADLYVQNSAQSQNFQFLGASNYLLFSDHPEVFAQFTQLNSNNSLSHTPRFNQIYSALPQQNLAFLYFDSEKIFTALAENPNFLDQKLSILQKYLPFLSLFSADGISIYAQNNNQTTPTLIAEQFSLFNSTKLPKADYFHTDYRLAGQLVDLLPEQSPVKLTSSHLQDQKNKLQQLFAGKSSVQELIFSGSLEQLKQNFLGNDFDLDKDFFPLFENEFAFSIDSIKQPSFSLILTIDKAQDEQTIQRLLLAIAKQVDLQSSVSKQTYILPDNTKGEQIIAHPVEPQLEQLQIEGHDTQKINFNGQLDLYFLVIGNHLLASTSQSNLTQIITKEITPSQSTPAPKQFFQQVDGITEFYSFNLAQILQDLQIPQYNVFTKPFSNFSIGRKFTELGLLSIYRLM